MVIGESEFATLPDFSIAARRILSFLRNRIPLQAWCVSRLTSHWWSVLDSEDAGYGFDPGTKFDANATLCAVLARFGNAAAIPDLLASHEFAACPMTKTLPLRAYIAAPIRLRSGLVVGTLAGFHPSPAAPDLLRELPMIEIFAQTLGMLLELDVDLLEQFDQMESANADSLRDPLTRLYNRAGWELLATAEERRAASDGTLLTAVSIDLDMLKHINDTQGHRAGDLYLRKAADVMRNTLRPTDLLARIGGDEFVALLVHCSADHATTILHRLEEAAARSGINLSAGASQVSPGEEIAVALHRADQAMYAVKRARPHHRNAPASLSPCNLLDPLPRTADIPSYTL